MIGLGTVANTSAIVVGGLLGTFFGKSIPARCQETVTHALAGATMFVGLGGTIQAMLKAGSDGALVSHGALMFVLSLAGGAFVGEALDLEGRFERFGAWMKKATHSEGDGHFVDAFVTTSLTFCIGAMAIIGSINDGLRGDPSVLLLKSVMDGIFCMVFAAGFGKGAVFSAVPIFLYQGALTVGARASAAIFTPAALTNLSYVGNVLIFFVGWNLLKGRRQIRVTNLLPSLAIAVLFGLFDAQLPAILR